MTPRSDHDDDMSMEEILASIRKFVTDNPPEAPTKQQRAYKGDLTESVVIPPLGHQILPEQVRSSPKYQAQPQAYELVNEDRSIQSAVQPQWQVSSQPQDHVQSQGYSNPVGEGRVLQPRHRQISPSSTYEPDILELNSPISPKGINQSQGDAWTTPGRVSAKSQEESIMTLLNPIDSKKTDKPARFSTKLSSFAEREESLGSAHALAASASSLSRLAQASKSTPKRSNLADQRDVTLDQLIQDLIRPMIKQWIDTHLPSLVEEMVAKEIKRITKHL